MDLTLAALVPLARMEERERRLKEDVRQHTRRVATPAEAARKAAEAVAALEAESAGHGRAMPALEAELKSAQDRRDRARTALDNGQISGETAERQVAQLTERMGQLEDTLLAHLDAIEALDTRIGQAKAAAAAASAAAGEAEATWGPQRAAAETELITIDAAREVAVQALPIADRGTFAGLRARKGYALSAVAGDLCALCNTAVPFTKRSDLKAGRVVSCSSCGRWLVEAG
jgi:predicted  nucleic acid-binding Zn-ribbon protein